jgi:hypothetical protein
MNQRIFRRIRGEIAELCQLKQIGYKGDACRNALPEQAKRVGQENKPADKIGSSQHNGERRK